MKHILLAVFSVLSIGGGYFAFGNNAPEGYGVGDKVENFSMKGTDGKTYSISDYDDKKAVVVIFTTNHCPYAKLYEDRIIAIQNKYATQGIQVLAINPNDAEVEPEDSFENMVIRAKEKGFNFPYLHDTDKIFEKFGATRTPEVYLINADKEVVYHGAIDDNAREATEVEEKYLENAIDGLLNGTKIDPNDTRAIGCSIKQ